MHAVSEKLILFALPAVKGLIGRCKKQTKQTETTIYHERTHVIIIVYKVSVSNNRTDNAINGYNRINLMSSDNHRKTLFHLREISVSDFLQPSAVQKTRVLFDLLVFCFF